MKQPIKGVKPKIKKNTHKKSCSQVNMKNNKKYGTSKLERDFAKNFLDKNGIVYIYEYEAKDIQRYYDFAITAYSEIDYEMEVKDGIKCVKQEGQYFPISFMLEIDGGYYHSDPRVVDENKLNPMQKHNKFVDKVKDKWCGLHCIPLLRIWEYDIKNNPELVLDTLKKYIDIGSKKKKIKENFKKPH